jgi:acetyl esterase
MKIATLLSIDKKRIGIGGDSAGANLAAGVVLRARDEKVCPLAYQLLIYPALGVDFDTDSYSKKWNWLWINQENDVLVMESLP